MDYIQSRAAGLLDDAQEKIDKAKEEHGEPRIIHHHQDDSKTVKSGDSTQDMVDMSHTSPMQKTETTAGTEASYVRELGFKQTKAGISLDVPSDFKGASDVKNRLKEIRMVNEELERMGQKRRYKASESDIPDNAHVHNDNFGKYYYKSLSVDIRPSDVADFAGVKHHGSLSKTQKAANTVELFHELHSPAIKDATSFKAADSWLSRHMILSHEAPASSDTFSHSFKEDIAAAISDTNRKREKERVYIDNPNEAPDDVNVEQGEQGGYYYETESGGGGDSEETLESWEVQEDAARAVDSIRDEYDLDNEEEFRQAQEDIEEEARRLAEYPEYGEEQVEQFVDYAQRELL